VIDKINSRDFLTSQEQECARDNRENAMQGQVY